MQDLDAACEEGEVVIFNVAAIESFVLLGGVGQEIGLCALNVLFALHHVERMVWGGLEQAKMS